MRLSFLVLLLASGVVCAVPRDSSLAQTAQPAQKGTEDDIWDVIKDTTNVGLLKGFLESYPNSRHATAARARLAAVTAPNPPAAAATPLLPPVTIQRPPGPPSKKASGPAKSFPQPRQGQDGPYNLRVDWCLNWATNCGKPAADAFCDARGFKQAVSFQSEITGGPTWVAGDRKICLHPACGALAAVACEGEADRKSFTLVDEFPTLTINHVPIATCLQPSRECGKPAADSVCRAIGFTRATHFSEAPGGGPIVHFGDGTPCTGEKCRVLAGVICSRG
jgi:hypothetical protein